MRILGSWQYPSPQAAAAALKGLGFTYHAATKQGAWVYLAQRASTGAPGPVARVNSRGRVDFFAGLRDCGCGE